MRQEKLLSKKKAVGIIIVLAFFLFAGFLLFNRYPLLWELPFRWDGDIRLFFDHFVAGFIIPVGFFIIFNGLFSIFQFEIPLRFQRRFLIVLIFITLIVETYWEIVRPFLFFVTQEINLLSSLYFYYLNPLWNSTQLLGGILGILLSIVFFNIFRKDLN